MTPRKDNPRRTRARLRAALLALVAVAAVTAPTAGANRNAPIETSLELELNIYDAHLSQACDTEVVAVLSGLLEKKVVVGKTSYEIITFHGRITWIARDSGETYSSALVNRTRVDFPEGIDLFKPAHVTVTGSHGGTFPIGGGPAGHGTLEYDAFVYAVDDEGFPYWDVLGGPTSMSGNFDNTARRICAALT